VSPAIARRSAALSATLGVSDLEVELGDLGEARRCSYVPRARWSLTWRSSARVVVRIARRSLEGEADRAWEAPRLRPGSDGLALIVWSEEKRALISCRRCHRHGREDRLHLPERIGIQAWADPTAFLAPGPHAQTPRPVEASSEAGDLYPPELPFGVAHLEQACDGACKGIYVGDVAPWIDPAPEPGETIASDVHETEDGLILSGLSLSLKETADPQTSLADGVVRARARTSRVRLEHEREHSVSTELGGEA
jgi:hypothetical protein